jgi:hypothetical protein
MSINTAARTGATHTAPIRKPTVAKRPFSRLTDGETHPVTVTLAKHDPSEPARFLPRMTALPEIGIRTALESLGLGHQWTEFAMSDCTYGCKVYQNDVTGERVVAHNSAYGCKKES